MVAVDLKGVAKVTAKGRTYYYAWRGGPRLRGSPGSPEFITSHQEAHANARAPDVARFHSLILLYKPARSFAASPCQPSAIGGRGSTASAPILASSPFAYCGPDLLRPIKLRDPEEPICRHPADGRLWPAGALSRALLRGGPSRQA